MGGFIPRVLFRFHSHWELLHVSTYSQSALSPFSFFVSHLAAASNMLVLQFGVRSETFGEWEVQLKSSFVQNPLKLGTYLIAEIDTSIYMLAAQTDKYLGA